MALTDSAVTVPGPERAGEGATVGPTVDRSDAQGAAPLLADRYTLGDKLGEGGMGVVRACRDRRIGRDVALKMVRTEHALRADLVSRFIREACVQGQLEHPSIVPVYDMARDSDGNIYFTMKRVRGATFEEIFSAIRSGDEPASKQFSRRKMLTAFASVCQALHFAHARGVIHRDLKPGNVIVGDFGEVYVLDWGLAKLTRGPYVSEPPSSGGREAVGGAEGHSLHGAAMGTPGYMAPEQVRGEAVDTRADVYALGALLFELLAHEPLHPASSREAAFASTLFGPDARPSLRAPHLDLPPELDAVCVRATALEPRDRFDTARQIVEAIERFLDGDRDLQRRRELAESHARLAAAHAERAFVAGPEATEARGRALRDAGRAIALDPSNSDAVGTLIRLLTDPPRELPPEALAELERDRIQSLGTGDRIASRAFSAWFLLAPMALAMGIRSAPAALLTTGAWMAAAAVSFISGRRDRTHGKASLPILLTGGFAIGCSTCFFGPYFFLPGFAVIYGMMFVLVPPDRSRRWLVIALSVLTILVPASLAWLGVTGRTYDLGSDAIVIHASMLHFPPIATQLFLVLSSLSVVVTACLMSARVHDELARAQERLHLQAWQLRQMLPRAARVAASDGSDAPRAPTGVS